MKEFKKFCLFAMVFCLALLIGVSESFAGPLGLFPNFHPGQRIVNGARAVGRVAIAPANAVGLGCGAREARQDRRASRRGYASGCSKSPAQAPVQAPQQKK